MRRCSRACRRIVKSTALSAQFCWPARAINGTVCGPHEGITALLDYFAQDPRLADIQPKFSVASEMAFNRMKVRLKQEIVTMGQPDIDPLDRAPAPM